MTIHCPFITVITPVKIIQEKFLGGFEAFRNAAPNGTFCTDGNLAAVSFMGPHDSRPWVKFLEENGLEIWGGEEGVDLHFRDIAVVEVFGGPTLPCDWLDAEYRDNYWVASLKGTATEEITFPDHWTEEDIDYFFHPERRLTLKQEKILANAPEFVKQMDSAARAEWVKSADFKRSIVKSYVFAGVWTSFGIAGTAISMFSVDPSQILSWFSISFAIAGIVKFLNTRDRSRKHRVSVMVNQQK